MGKVEVQRHGIPELCDVAFSDESDYAICRDDDGHNFIAKRRLGAWMELSMMDILSSLKHCDRIMKEAAHLMAAEAARLDLQ